MNTCTDPIKAEIAKLNPKFELQLKSRRLAQLLKEINSITGSYYGFISRDGAKLQLPINSLLDINSRPDIAKIDGNDYPFRASATVGGIEYYTIFSRDEWLEWAKDNQICVECGKDFEWTRVGEREYRCPNDCGV